MKKIGYIAEFMLLSFLGQAQTWAWAKSGDGANAGGDEGMAVCTDPSGNVFITGLYDDPVITFGTYTLTNASSSSDNSYLVKYDPAGNVLWARSTRVTGAGAGWSNSVAADASGNTYIAGFFTTPSISFGTYTLTNSGPLNMFLVKYDPNGNVLWARNSTGTVGIVANSVCTDAAGNTLITGYFLDSVATLGTYTLTNGGTAENIFLAKYDAAGNVLWATSEGSTGYDFGNAVCTDGAGNVYLTGAFQSPVISFGTYTLTNTGVQNVFLAKYDMNGNALWAERAAGSYADQGNSVTCDVAGNVYITGFFKSPSVSFGTYTLTNSVGVNVPNIFMVKYDATGNVLWARGAGGSGGFFGDVGYSVSSYTNGVFLAGALGSPTLALGTYTLSPPPGSSDPMFIAGYDFNGNVIYATALASGGDDINGISCDQFCNVYVTGDFIASPFVIGTTSLTLIGTENPFVAKFALTCQPTNVNSLSTEENVFLISPNPNNGAFRLQVDGEIENGEVALINSLGQTVFTQTVKKGMNGVVTTVLSKGLYHYVILQNNRPIGRGKLLID